MTDTIQSLIERRDRARDRFAALDDLRPGTLNEHYRKCGKPNCRCAREGDPGHGPSYILSRSLKGRKKSLPIRPEEVAETRGLVGEYGRFRELVAEFLEASEALAEARRLAGRATGAASEKGGTSRRRSRRRSVPK